MWKENRWRRFIESWHGNYGRSLISLHVPHLAIAAPASPPSPSSSAPATATSASSPGPVRVAREGVRVRVRGSAVHLTSMGGLFLHERVSWGQEWVDQLRADTWMHAFSFGAAQQQQQAEGERPGWEGGGERGCRDMDGNSGVGSAAGSAAAAQTRGSTAHAEDTSGGDGAADVIQVLLDASHGTAEVRQGTGLTRGQG
ncbi:hypothetical protein CLOP_g2021 [Closterium sp. NIES-67]|nr:hypothetical protein CLOP_g2021 [Closterium sp. NIES-67]